jgi:hypothetical protein
VSRVTDSELGYELPGALGRAVGDGEVAATLIEQGDDDRSGGTTGAEQGHAEISERKPPLSEREEKTGNIGIVAEEPLPAHDDCVDRTDTPSAWSEFVHQLRDRLFVRDGDVRPHGTGCA